MSAPIVRLERFNSPTQLTETAAHEWIKTLRLRTNPLTPCTVALPGGRMASSFLSAAAREALTLPHGFRNVHFFWTDERCVPPDHADSNFRLAQVALLDPLRVPASQTHRTIGEAPPEIAAKNLALALNEICGRTPTGTPILDRVFLGMGEDGHIASLFPEPNLDETDEMRLVFPVISPKPPPHRVTMGYGILTAALEVWVLISGPGKAQALERSLAGTTTPLGKLLHRRRLTVVWHDFPVERGAIPTSQSIDIQRVET